MVEQLAAIEKEIAGNLDRLEVLHEERNASSTTLQRVITGSTGRHNAWLCYFRCSTKSRS